MAAHSQIRAKSQPTADADDAWFWADAWQQSEREAQAEIAAGGSETYTHDEFLQQLEERST